MNLLLLYEFFLIATFSAPRTQWSVRQSPSAAGPGARQSVQRRTSWGKYFIEEKYLWKYEFSISPVILHLLLAAEPFAAPVALVVAGDVAPLMDHQVVSLAEASVTPTTVEGFSNRLDLKEKFVLIFVFSVFYYRILKGWFSRTLNDFFLFIILVSYMSMLRLTANILNIWVLVLLSVALCGAVTLSLHLTWLWKWTKLLSTENAAYLSSEPHKEPLSWSLQDCIQSR